jgi:transcriptional regulator with XRE-family HTH domain
MHNRLKQFLAAENITQAQFANTIGVGKANISHVLAGRNKPGYDFIKAIMIGFPHLNVNWLLLGTGKMYDIAKPIKERPESDEALLFDNEDLPLFMDEPDNLSVSEPQGDVLPVIEQNIQAITSIKETVNSTQVPVKQRKVSKIIVLFDDGSFQEM